jgi:hypothetical protein
MSTEELKKDVIGFMYAERLKTILLIGGQMLDVVGGLDETERSGGLKMLGAFVSAASSEMNLIAGVMGDQNYRGLDDQLKLVEGYARLGQMEAARQELSRTLTKVTTLSSYAMTSLRNAGLL